MPVMKLLHNGSPVSMGTTYLVPGVGAIGRVDEQGQDLGPGHQSGRALGGGLAVEVVGTLLKHEVCADVGGEGEEVHIPEEETREVRGCVCVCVCVWLTE